MRPDRPSGRVAAATAALIVHGLLILVFVRADRGTRANPPQGIVRARILYLVRPRQQGPRTGAPTGATARRPSRKPRSVTLAPMPALPLSTKKAEIPAPYHPKPDWHEAADVVARSLTSWHGTKVHPGSGEHPLSPYRDCDLQPQFAWDPEPERVGLIDHWLPYLRLGSHCIVTLGMFGCAVGHLPGPNGQLFDHSLGGKATQNSTRAARMWPDGEPRGPCRPHDHGAP